MPAHLSAAVQVAAWSGLRAGELFALDDQHRLLLQRSQLRTESQDCARLARNRTAITAAFTMAMPQPEGDHHTTAATTRGMIVARELLTDGDRLPSLRDIAETAGVSYSTARRARLATATARSQPADRDRPRAPSGRRHRPSKRPKH